ncbi:hypothetical protein [Bizionia arctica]|uniref:Uncharacterized protein n=1 Tax=Bizionia arctica TaxID=1495645 RepID=A0A917LSS3_9FLAO|nr:hypothetical protein [Bizionia arctica]GGG54618.1 hypothetical protein GCM10010976_26930 [Bizionia arctica]
MKKIIPITLIMLFLAFSCQDDDTENPLIENDNIDTGIFGRIEYARADCMPGNTNPIDFNNYNGEIYFIIKSELENLGNEEGAYEELKSNSIHFNITDGVLETELPEEVYLVLPEDVYLYDDYNTVTIESGVALYKNFRFKKCVSY